jgi:cobyrinic acid a,c-diamide synthase
LESAAAALGNLDLNDVPVVEFNALPPQTPPLLLEGVRIAIARDSAFAFLYQANLDLLEAMGAQLLYFSPLTDAEIPRADAVYLPGGYPELHAARLAANTALGRALQDHHRQDKPILAECGGMMYLLGHLTDRGGTRHALAGLLAGETIMQPRLQALALQSADLGSGELHGHSFHHSRLQTEFSPHAFGRTQHGTTGEPVFRVGWLAASYIHFYFPSNPQASAQFFLP